MESKFFNTLIGMALFGVAVMAVYDVTHITNLLALYCIPFALVMGIVLSKIPSIKNLWKIEASEYYERVDAANVSGAAKGMQRLISGLDEESKIKLLSFTNRYRNLLIPILLTPLLWLFIYGSVTLLNTLTDTSLPETFICGVKTKEVLKNKTNSYALETNECELNIIPKTLYVSKKVYDGVTNETPFIIVSIKKGTLNAAWVSEVENKKL